MEKESIEGVIADIQGNDWEKIKNYIGKSGNKELNAIMNKTDSRIKQLTGFVAQLTEELSVVKAGFQEVKEECTTLKGDISSLNVKMDKLLGLYEKMVSKVGKERKQRLKAECRSLQSTVMMRGVEIHPTATQQNRTETQTETRKQVTDLLTKFEIDMLEFGVADCYRLTQRPIRTRDGMSVLTDTIRIAFKLA